MNFLGSSLPFDILSSSPSHFAVNRGDFNSLGTRSINCFPFEVGIISLPFFSITNELNNLSIISALVATVPSPPVSPKVLADSLSTFIYLWGY